MADGYVQPDSALVRAADDLLGKHTGEPGTLCDSCMQILPCPAVRHATEVRRAAGLGATPPARGGNGGLFISANAAASNHTSRRFAMEQRGASEEPRQVPATTRDTADNAALDDFDHTGRQEQKDLPGGTRGGGNPNSQLGR